MSETRTSASDLVVGDTARIFGAVAGDWTKFENTYHRGTVVAIEEIALAVTTNPALRFTFDDGRQVDALTYAVSYKEGGLTMAADDPNVRITVTRSAGDDRAVVVQIDTDFEPTGNDGPGLRILLNDDEVYAGVAYDFGVHHEAKSVSLDVSLDQIGYTGRER